MLQDNIRLTLQAAYRTGRVRCGCPVEYMTSRDIASGLQRLNGWCVSPAAIESALRVGVPGVKFNRRRNAYCLEARFRRR